MPLPDALLASLKDVEGFDRKAFEKVHLEASPVVSVRINPAKTPMVNGLGAKGEILRNHPAKDRSQQGAPTLRPSFTIQQAVPWSLYGFYLEQRPSFTFDPLFHAGCYYVQEASSMFLEQAMKQLIDLSLPLKVLDLSAAPGGKSTHIQSLLSEQGLLVSNEVIRSRCNVLKDNIIKWGSSNVMITNNDPAAFKKLPGYFDVIVVDAPCSGSGLFRKDPDAISEWSLNNVALCSQRQQRILADVLPALKQNGLLIYSTCSYSKEEDEDIADWLVREFAMKNEKLQLEKEWGIVEAESLQTRSLGYRFYPDKVKGEGFFISCFRKTADEKEVKQKPAKLEKASAREKAILQPWLKEGDNEFIRDKNAFAALPPGLVNDYAFLRSALNVQYGGTGLGQIMKDKLVPDHSLALSTLLSDNIPTTGISYEEAIKYLQRQELSITPETTGWQTVNYQKHALGWINALASRINNYYPKELRILKRENDSAFEK